MDDLDYEKHLEDYKRLFGYYASAPYIWAAAGLVDTSLR